MLTDSCLARCPASAIVYEAIQIPNDAVPIAHVQAHLISSDGLTNRRLVTQFFKSSAKNRFRSAKTCYEADKSRSLAALTVNERRRTMRLQRPPFHALLLRKQERKKQMNRVLRLQKLRHLDPKQDHIRTVCMSCWSVYCPTCTSVAVV